LKIISKLNLFYDKMIILENDKYILILKKLMGKLFPFFLPNFFMSDEI